MSHIRFAMLCAIMITGAITMGQTKAELSMAGGGSNGDAVEQQISELCKAVRGKRVALLTNPTGVDNQLNLLADRLVADGQTTIVAFFAPEHGVRGDRQAGAKVTDYIDSITSVPVFSIYGPTKAPKDEQLSNTDVLVFDIQNVGVRFYTFTWSLTHAMESAARNKVKFVVFDRPEPMGADRVEGAPHKSEYGLVGRMWPNQKLGVATWFGMTPGEFATMVNSEWLEPKCELQVIRIPGYKRSMTFEQTGRPWVPPSPNIPTVDSAVVYPGTCVFEGSNISEGRGTTKPFEVVGAPFVDGNELAQRLNALRLPGVRFRPLSFRPFFSKYANEYCGGVQLHVLDRSKFDPIRSALHILKAIVEMYPEQVRMTDYASRLMAVPDLDKRIKTESVDAIVESWQADLEQFKAVRAKYLLYQ